jgi:hypothetical protein
MSELNGQRQLGRSVSIWNVCKAEGRRERREAAFIAGHV